MIARNDKSTIASRRSGNKLLTVVAGIYFLIFAPTAAATTTPIIPSTFDRANAAMLEAAFKDETIVTTTGKKKLSAQEQARLNYQNTSKQFLRGGQSRANAITHLQKQQNLPAVLQRKVKLMTLVHAVETQPDKNRPQHIAALRQLLPRLNAVEKIVANHTLQRASERVAITQWQAGKFREAAATYTRLIKQFEAEPRASNFERRLVDIRNSEYQKTSDPKAYEQLLLRLRQKYTDSDGENAAMAKFVATRYASLISRETQLAKSTKATTVQRQRAIAMLQRHIETLSEGAQLQNAQEQQADIYALVPNHRKASAIYLDLALNSKSNRTGTYLRKAINSQAVLANWPATAPWDGFKNGSRNDRLSLLETYKKLNELHTQQINWPVAAQVGWLEIALGEPQAAFDLWMTSLNKSTRGTDAALATGYMLTAYQRAKRWDDLESLSRLSISKNIPARFQRQPLTLNSLLALALFEGGKQAHANQEFAKAAAKLKEFTASFRKDGRRAEALYTLAHAYRGDAKHVEALDILMALANEYPSSPYLRNGLLNGGEWAIAMAAEEQAIYFYQAFITRFGTDKQAPQVRMTLADLYMGRALYAQAITVYREQMSARNVDRELALTAALAILDIENRHGSPERANTIAERILKMPVADADKVSAYAVRARFLENSKNYKALATLEAQLEKIADTSEGLQDVLGEVRFLQAQRNGKTATAEFFNLGLRDPFKTLGEKQAIFARAQRGYEQVCAAGKTTFCAPAMHHLARMAEDMLGNIEDLSIAETLDEATVNRFKARKRELVNALLKVAESSDERALAAATAGRTSPDWTTQILWNNTSDWTFDRIAGETGNSYIQWSPVTTNVSVEE